MSDALRYPVRLVGPADRAEWLRMRHLLWPDEADEHGAEIDAFLAAGDPSLATFVLARPDGRLGGFLEAGSRPYAEGCAGEAGYIEGWWVDADLRRQGHGRRLVAAAEAWARDRGFGEMASDALLDNRVSHLAHGALGYQEVERIVCFRKSLVAGEGAEPTPRG
jgi:aminoglycoside 6'-N-acetyltransferase I